MISSNGTGAPTSRRRSFADLSVNVKILIAVCIAVAVGILVGVLSLNALSRASDSAQVLYRSNVASLTAIGQVDATLSEGRLAIANHSINSRRASSSPWAIPTRSRSGRPSATPRSPR
jgi:methyl-accepting chemotaxis protein